MIHRVREFLRCLLEKGSNAKIKCKSTLGISVITNDNGTKNISELIKTTEESSLIKDFNNF